jgi:short-subunit dehydrogenase
MTQQTTLPSREVALVTGASSGIGEAAARALGRAGFEVALVARRGERLERIAKEIEEAGGRALAISADLSDDEATSRVVDTTLATFGRIDLLVNNAGYSPGAAIEQTTRDDIRQIFEVNLFSGLQLISQIVPEMRRQGGGRIISIGSIAGFIPAPLAIPYAATKAALYASMRGLRLELAQWKIRLSLVVPGFVDTAVFDNAREGSQHLREDPENPYRQTFFDLDDLAKSSLKNALTPEDAGELIVRVATARRPRERYVTPFSAWLQIEMLGLLPDRLVDWILRRVYKLDAG